jgi:hypothetical protein
MNRLLDRLLKRDLVRLVGGYSGFGLEEFPERDVTESAGADANRGDRFFRHDGRQNLARLLFYFLLRDVNLLLQTQHPLIDLQIKILRIRSAPFPNAPLLLSPCAPRLRAD